MAEVKFAKPSASASVERDTWRPYLVTKEAIDQEIARLAAGRMPAAGCRSSSIVHPQATDGIPGFTPVTEISINVLKPGERTIVRRGNYSLLETAILGSGRANIANSVFPVALHDVWTVPSMKPYFYENTSNDTWAWLTYSNSALLRRIGAYWAEENLSIEAVEKVTATASAGEQQYTRKTGPVHVLPTTGTELRSYEHLTDIEPLPNPPLHWAWDDIAPHLPIHRGDNEDPDKRGIWLMYNPATERRQGTTPIHFATYAGSAPGTPPYAGKRGHFHISASINYHTSGDGYSIVDGERVDWKAGDLLFSAPSWLEHAHYFGEYGCTILTVQDHPMHISTASLLWQENPNDPVLSLGSEEGQKGYVFPREAGR
jgi:gentisate 1,2-dioxygenase